MKKTICTLKKTMYALSMVTVASLGAMQEEDRQQLLNSNNNAISQETMKKLTEKFHKAVDNGCIEDVNSLLNQGVDIDSKASSFVFGSSTALYRAAMNSYCSAKRRKLGSEMVQLLIDRGASVNEVSHMKSLAGSYKETPLQAAARMRNADIVKRLLSVSDIDVNVKDDKGRTPLHRAWICEHIDIVKILINAKNIDISVIDGITSLHVAARWGNAEEVQNLLNNGADAKVKDIHNRTPLHAAKHLDVVEILLKNGAEINGKDVNGRTLLHYMILLENERTTSKEFCFTNDEPYYAEAKSIVEFLLNNGANVDEKDLKGRTPLYYEIAPYHRTHTDMVEVLIAHGANPNEADIEGKTPLDKVPPHRKDIVKILKSK